MVANEQLTLTTLSLPALRPQIATEADYAACRAIMRGASKNYSFASDFLPESKVRHVEALYALLRVGDDRVDVSHQDFDSPLEAIEDWEWTYHRAFETGDSPDPVMRAYLDTAITCDIPRETMLAYFRAMKEDLTITRFPTFEHLMHYMAGSAIPVGRAMTYILGVREPHAIHAALPAADALSVAMQLSNFWRDIGEDYRRSGRIYLPQEDMDRFGVREDDIAAGRVTDNFVRLLEFEFARTEAYYAQAREGVHLLAHARWAIMSALEIYHAILPDIQRHGYDVFSRRAGAGRWGKARLALRALGQVRLGA
jgi:phytoene synthase